MVLFDRKLPIDHLRIILEKEHDAIVAGDLELIARIGPEKERSVENLKKAKLSLDDLTQLRRLSGRNDELLTATRAGIDSALKKLRAIRDGQSQLQTYDRAGQRQHYSFAPSKSERRA